MYWKLLENVSQDVYILKNPFTKAYAENGLKASKVFLESAIADKLPF